jgi:hypothetical protein
LNFIKIASPWVRCRPEFPLGGGFHAEQFALAWWKQTTGVLLWSAISARGCSGGQPDIMRPPCRVLLLFGGGMFRRELFWLCSDFRREGNFLESNLSGFCSGGIQQVCRAPQETSFLLQWYSRDTQSTTWVLISCFIVLFISRRGKLDTAGAKTALQDILLLEEIQDTQTDTILKKFY